jgi:hypothetical protein
VLLVIVAALARMHGATSFGTGIVLTSEVRGHEYRTVTVHSRQS